MAKKHKATFDLTDEERVRALQHLAERLGRLQRRGGGKGKGSAGALIDDLALACQVNVDAVVQALEPIFTGLLSQRHE